MFFLSFPIAREFFPTSFPLTRTSVVTTQSPCRLKIIQFTLFISQILMISKILPLHFYEHYASSKMNNLNLKEDQFPYPEPESSLHQGNPHLFLQVNSIRKTPMPLGFRLWLVAAQITRSSVLLIILGSCFNQFSVSRHMKIKGRQWHIIKTTNPLPLPPPTHPHNKKNKNANLSA